jgi:signal transduction histidine kinase
MTETAQASQPAYRRLDHGAHVLVVEDHPVTLKFLDAALKENGYRVTLMNTAAGAMAALDQELPDLVVLDLHLPDIHGLEVCRYLRQLLGGEDIPVLVVTIEGGSEGHAEAVRAGVDDFLRKPILPVELKTRARSLLRLRYLRRELRADRESLLEMQSQKENLLQFVTHDLKNLLATAKAALDLMGETRDLSRHLHYQGRMGESLRAMLAMVTDLMDLSISDRAELVLEFGTFEMRPWLEKVVHEFEPLALRRRQWFELDVPDGLLVEADPQLLCRVVANLLENATRHAPAASPISVKVERTGEAPGLRILVSDRGTGVPAELKDEIFDRYVRLKSRQETRPSRGLGLTFCRLVMTLHQGRIWVEDVVPTGSRFILELPGLQAQPD